MNKALRIVNQAIGTPDLVSSLFRVGTHLVCANYSGKKEYLRTQWKIMPHPDELLSKSDWTVAKARGACFSENFAGKLAKLYTKEYGSHGDYAFSVEPNE